MTHINPTIPAVGDTNWGLPLNTALRGIVAQVNSLDDEIATLTAGGVVPNNGFSVVDNGDGTLTLVGTGVTDNGDGTLTLSAVTDNADGTFTVVDGVVTPGQSVGDMEPLGLSHSTRATLAATYVAKDSAFQNVLDHNLIGDGTTDDTAALTALLAAAPTDATIWFPAGRTFKLTGGITLGKRLHLRGPGLLSFTAGIANASAITIAADGCSVEGIRMANPNLLGAQTGTQPYAIFVTANDVTISRNYLDSFQSGIGVAATGEWANVVIAHNRIKDVLGAGDGSANTTSTYGEDRGDGITVWGCQATIVGNIVNCKAGSDGRIGIHSEGLSAFEGGQNPAHPDAMVTISGNVVYGRFRRSLVSEGVKHVAITGNSVADATWWGIGCFQAADFSTITGNSILVSRTASDQQGQVWNPLRAAIMVYGNTGGVQVTGNSVRAVSGSAIKAFLATASQDSSNAPYDIHFSGNTCVALGGAAVEIGIYFDNWTRNIRATGNTVVGMTTFGVYGYGAVRPTVSGNMIRGISSTTLLSEGIHFEAENTNPVAIDGNRVQWATLGASVVNNSAGARVTNNEFDTGTTGIEGYGTSPMTCTGNNFYNISGTKVQNAVNGGSNLVVNNN